jgi:hypothetical protein
VSVSLRRRLAIAAIAVAALPRSTLAHGDVVAMRGGLAVPAGEHSVELVLPALGQVRVYVDDHGEPVAVERAEGTVTVVRSQGGADQFAVLRPASPSTLEGDGIDLITGDRVQVVVKLVDGQVVVAKAVIP